MSDNCTHSTIAILDHFDLTGLSPERLRDKVLSWKTSKAKAVAESLSNAIQLDAPPQVDASVFSFFAAAPIRGEACWELECQTRDLRMLARYAALYADQVVVPVEFWLPSRDEFEDRITLCHQLNTVMQLRSVIEAGVVRPVPSPLRCYCPDCLAKQGVNLSEVRDAARRFFEEELLRLFRVIYRPPKYAGSDACLEIQGPEEYIPHGQTFVRIPSRPTSTTKRMKLIDGAPGALMSKATVKRQRLLSYLAFDHLVEDFIAQQIYRAYLGTTYLTNSPGQARFLGAVTKRDGWIANAAHLCALLGHNVPDFADVPLDFILRLRNKEPEAFIRYRAAVNQIARDHLDPDRLITKRDAAEIYYDVLRPRLVF